MKREKPRIKPDPSLPGWFVCEGFMIDGLKCMGWGKTHRSAYMDWRTNDIPF